MNREWSGSTPEDTALQRYPGYDSTGSVLIITLLLLTLLTGLAVQFAYGVYIGTSALANWSDAQKASLTAKSGQAIFSSYIKEIQALKYTYHNNVLIPVPHDFGGETILTVRIEDENAKFNVNSIIHDNGYENEKAMKSLTRIFEYLDVDPSLTLIIADWIDPDGEPRTGDSELDAKNAPLWDIGELRFIDGIDDETFHAISPFLRVHGNNLININTAELPVLVSLHEDMTEMLAQKIIDYREITPFQDKTNIINISGFHSIGMAIQAEKITVKSSLFRVVAQAKVSDTVREIESIVDTSMKVHAWREG